MYGRCTGDVRAMYGGYAGVRFSGRPPRRGNQFRHAATRAHARARTHEHAGPFDWPEVNALRKFRVGSPRTCVLVRPLAWGGGCAWHGSKNARSRSRPVAFPPRPLLFNVGACGSLLRPFPFVAVCLPRLASPTLKRRGRGSPQRRMQ